MDHFKVFFVILIAFNCQILAKPPINKNLESSKTLDSEEISASEEIEIKLSQENEGPELVFPDPKVDLETMEKEVAHDEEVKVNYSQSKSPFITRCIRESKYQGVEKK